MYMLTITTETYSRTESGKSWKTKPDDVTTQTLPWDRRDVTNGSQHGEAKHRNITDADTLRFFRRIGGSERATRSYTPVGFIITRIVSSNPDRTLRRVRRFRITDV